MAQKQEVIQLRKALEKERCALRSAQDEVAALRAALDSERSAVRALRRDITNQIKKVKEEETEKYTTLVEQLKNKTSLEQEEALKNQKENIHRAITAEFQRLQQSREAELQREATRKEEDLRRQLRDALNKLNELTNKTNNSSHQTSSATSSNTNSTSTATSVAINHNELQACRAQYKQLELRVQELLEAERRNADQVRTQHEENLAREAELQKIARRETHILLEKLKSKDRTIELLQKEMRKLKGRLEASCRNHPDMEKPGEPPRIGIKKRLALKTSGLSVETARTRCDPIKETISNDSTDQHSSCDNTNSTTQETDTQEKGPTDDNTTKTNGKDIDSEDEENEKESNNEDLGCASSLPPQETDIAINSWTKAVGLETLYQVVVAEHQELQRAHQALAVKLKAEQKARADLEASIQQNRSENPINLALAAQIQELTARQAELISENHDLREQNDLLEFRLLEIDSGPSSLHFKTPSSPSRSPESRGDREVDDISDSGVLSLPTSEDISETDFHELAMEPCNRDIKSKLSHLCQTVENISDRISIQQGLALLRHYEARLEATLANMSPDMTKCASIPEIPLLTSDSTKSQSRIIATVLPFTDLSQTNGKQKDELPIKKLLKDADCLQESGIFEESSDSPEYCTRWTQTDWSPEKLEATPGDLSLEIRKLKQIRERIEEKGGNKRLLRVPDEEDHCQNVEIKELLFYRGRVEILENKLAIYESSGDEQIRRLNTRLEKEILLSAQLKHLKERCNYLEELNRRLEEEKCEFEEAENDTRLRCQKLEVKLSALGEKKSDLQVQLQQNARTMANLKSCLAEEEKKRIEARQHASQMEGLVQCYEQRNFELEEKEMEARWRCQMLEGAIPALMAYNTWKTSEKVPRETSYSYKTNQTSRMLPPSSQLAHSSTYPRDINSDSSSEKSCDTRTIEELYHSLKSLKTDLSTDYERIEQSKPMEASMQGNVKYLEGRPFPSHQNKEFEGGLTREQKEELCNRLKILCKEKKDLETQVKDLELKECYYKQTLQQADGMWASMEQEYKDQIRQYETKLEEKQKELQSVEELVSKLCSEKHQRKCLQERVSCLESDIKDLNFKLAEKELEKKHFEREEHRLCCELATTSEELNYVKNCIEPCLRKQLDDNKKMVKELRKEIQDLEKERETDLEDRQIELALNPPSKTDEHDNKVTEVYVIVKTPEEGEATDSLKGVRAPQSTPSSVVSPMGSFSKDQAAYSRPVPHSSVHDQLVEEKKKLNGSQISLNDEFYSATDFTEPQVLQNDNEPPEEPGFDTKDESSLQATSETAAAEPSSESGADAPAEPTSESAEDAPAEPSSESAADAPAEPTSESAEDAPAEPSSEAQNDAPEEANNQPLDKGHSNLPKKKPDDDDNTNVDDSDLLKPTIPSLLTTVQTLLNKINSKDQLIQCLADQLIILAESGCCWRNSLLECIACYPSKRSVDFDCAMLVDYLAGFIYLKTSEVVEASETQKHPLDLKIVGATTFDSLLISWKVPNNGDVYGFDIYVNDELVERIRDSQSSRTLLHPIDMQQEILITVCALDKCGIHLICDIICIPPVSVKQSTSQKVEEDSPTTEISDSPTTEISDSPTTEISVS